MKEPLHEILETKFHKETLLKYLQKSPENFAEAFQLALSVHQPAAWRAAWILGHATTPKDPRIEMHIAGISEIILTRPDGHQRELLKLLEKSAIPENLEGKVYDICATLWENTAKIPSVRMVAIRIMWEITHKYPELQREMEFYVQEHYLEDLSPGIRNSIHRMIKKRQD
jgi:hypothetical protein